MFLYVAGILNQEDAVWAASRKVSAIGVALSYRKGALQAEAARELFLGLPQDILRVGIFRGEPLFHVFELATFCALDILHFVDTPAGAVRSEGQRIFFESENETAGDVLIRSATSYRQGMISRAGDESLLLAGDLTLSQWRQTFLCCKPYGIMLDRKGKNCEEVLTWFQNQSSPLTDLREREKVPSPKR